MNFESRRMRFYQLRDLDKIPELQKLSEDERFAMRVASNVLPFRSNAYVVEDLINWDNVPNDPMYQLTFMQRGMLDQKHFDRIADLLQRDASQEELKNAVNEVRLKMNPHPAGQLTANVPEMEDNLVQGVQHKYRETTLIFPSAGQTCFSYCTFCFRWPQFVGMDDLKFATDESNRFQEYLKNQIEITDVLFTGGDPMIMKASKLAAYLEPLLEPVFDHIQTIRIGTKVLGYWPYRFVTDKDSDEILRLFEKVTNAGKHLAIMAHYNHPVELSTDIAKESIRRLQMTGAQIRSQSPVLKHINADPEIWAEMWKEQVKLGIIPYYMFVERDTGPKQYFELPLEQAYDIFQAAFQKVSGLGRTVRGPSMSAFPGKVCVEGMAEIKGEKVFVLTLLQGRKPDWVKKPFFAKYDPAATWLSDLKPAFGERTFFYESELAEIIEKIETKELKSTQSEPQSPGLKIDITGATAATTEAEEAS
jgi:KamA family protein